MAKPRHTDSLLFVWRIAELEARHLHTQQIEPVHLLIGLCKIVDVDLPALLSKDTPDRDAVLEELLRETRRLRTAFQTAGVQPRDLRRALRRSCEGSRDVIVPAGRLHRSSAGKDVFADAEHFADIAGSAVFPIHLLCALVTTRSPDRDEVMSECGFSLDRLASAAQREALLGANPVKTSSGLN